MDKNNWLELLKTNKIYNLNIIKKIDKFDEINKKRIIEIYLQIELLKKIYYYYYNERKDPEISKLYKQIEIYIKKLEILSFEINEIKELEIKELDQQINNYILELKYYLENYKKINYSQIYNFNYFIWFFYNYSQLDLSLNTWIEIIYNPKELYFSNKNLFIQKYELLYNYILYNAKFNFIDINIDNFLYYLDNFNLTKFIKENYSFDISNDEKDFYFDILVDFEFTNFWNFPKNFYYLYRKSNIYIIDFEKLIMSNSPLFINFDNMFDFFSNNIFELPQNIKTGLKKTFNKLHFTNEL